MSGKLSGKNCHDCKYFYGHSDYVACCNYIFVTGKRRPCPPGDGCTVKVKRKKKWVSDWERKQKKKEDVHERT